MKLRSVLTRLSGATVSVSALLLAPVASATFVVPSTSNVGFDAQTAKTTYGQWDVFLNAALLPNSPDVGAYNDGSLTAGDPLEPTLTQTTPGAFLTSGGNIYSPFLITGFDTVLPAADDATAADIYTRVVVQFGSFGSEFDYDSLELTNGSATVSPVDEGYLSYLFDQITIPGQGTFPNITAEYIAVFDIVGPPSELTLSFAAGGTSASLDTLRIDTFSSSSPLGATDLPTIAIPEPASGVLLVLAAGLVGVGRRRR